MFKSLREKLKGVSKKLETEVEKSLEDKLEQELAEAVAKARAPDTVPARPPEPAAPAPFVPATPATAQPTRQERVEPPAQPSFTPQPPVQPPAAPPAAAPSSAPAAAPLVPPAPAPVPASPAPTAPTAPTAPVPPAPSASPSQPSASQPSQAPGLAQTQPSPFVPASPATAQPTRQERVAPEPQPSFTSQPPVPGGAGPARPAQQPPRAEPVAAPSAVPVAPTAPTPPAQGRPIAERTGGRKMLTEEEITARLERELSEAVAVQKAVETVVQQEAPAATRFTINEEVLEEILWDLEVGLLESDVALPVIEAIKANVKEQLLTLAVGGKRPEEIVEKVLRTAIKRVLMVNPIDFDQFIAQRLAAGKRPVVVMFVGVNGTGKTTSIGRIAHRLKQKGIGVVMAAGDTFRAGAIEQLALHGERLGVAVVKHKAGADPAAVAFDAIEHAKARNKEVVLLDTAGRMQNNSNLMDEMDKIRRVANPDLVVFVGDSLAGNDAVEQARKFDEIVDVGGVILTKVDVDAKGGAALSVAYTINKPLLFVGVGQGYDDLKPFDADWLVNRLFGDDEEQVAAVP